MRVFVAGATGAIGQYLVPSLVAAGHEVTGTTRSTAKAAGLQAAGATPVIVDGLDRLVGLVTPETIGEMLMLHQALPSGVRFGPWGPSTRRSADTPAR